MGTEIDARSSRHSTRLRSLTPKLFVFTAVLCFSSFAIFLGYDLIRGNPDLPKTVLLCLAAAIVSAAIACVTIPRLVRPLALLEKGVAAARNGDPKPVDVPRTGDEVESLGDGFNDIIRALAVSKEEIREHQKLLEDRIRKRTEQLREITLRAEAASTAKSEFLANMSHELRTPMNGLIGMLDLVLEGEIYGEQRERMEAARECALSLVSIVNDILDLATIEAGKITINRIPFNLRTLTEDCIRCHQSQCAANGVNLLAEIDARTPAEVTGDPLHIRQILNNLLSNAVKFTSQGSITVRLKGIPAEPGAIGIHLEVEDTGPSIPLEKLPYIFDKFPQDADASRKSGGAGLGLAITKQLTEMLGGGITVTSELGRGAVFSVDLKLGISAAGASLQREEAEHASPLTETRILVVEDNQVNQKVVTAVLRKRGYGIDLANDGQEAISKLETGEYDIILMDVQMPVLDGLEATRIIRRNPRWQSLPIIAMTAHAMNGDRERCLRAGMTTYVSKPVHPSHLLQVIDEHLAVSQQTQALGR